MPKPSDLLQGTLDLLILKTITREPVHGWGIAKRIQMLSAKYCRCSKGRSIQHFTAWNSGAGSMRNGKRPNSAAAPSFMP